MDGPYTWINFPKAFILSNPRAAATFTALPATAQRNSNDPPTEAAFTYVGVFLLSIIRTENPPALGYRQIARPCRIDIRLRSSLCPTACSCGVSPSSIDQDAHPVEK